MYLFYDCVEFNYFCAPRDRSPDTSRHLDINDLNRRNDRHRLIT